MKTKVESYGDEVTDVYDKEIPKMDSNHTCLAVISLDSALQKDENYLDKKSVNTVKNKLIRHINDNLSNESNE